MPSLSNAVKGRKIGRRFRAGFPTTPIDPREILERIGSRHRRNRLPSRQLAVTRALSNATLVPVSPLCVVVDAVQSASAVPIHTNPWLLVLSVAGALALLARRSGLEASQITLKPINMKHRKERP
jgi:hypothetical protein